MNDIETFLRAAALAGEFAADILKENDDEARVTEDHALSEKTRERLRVIADMKDFAIDLLTKESAPKPEQKKIEVLWKDMLQAKGWRVRETRQDGAAYENWNGMLVIASVAKESDGKDWLHISASFPTRQPTWNEMVEIRNLLIGEHQYAVMVVPPKRFYVKIHPHVMHLFSCLEGHYLPEFSGKVEGVKTI